MRIALVLKGLLAALPLLLCASIAQASDFDIVVLGAAGGLDDGTLSAYLIRPEGSDRGVLCDAGTVLHGLKDAAKAGAFKTLSLKSATLTPEGEILHTTIAAYLISHAHLDHIAGLIAISPDDTPKPIMALASVNTILAKHIFNWQIWPNMGDKGVKPRLGTYRYDDLTPEKPTPISGTSLQVQAYPLNHGGVESTAFLLTNGQDALLYLGDTGPDAPQHSDHLHRLWQAIVPLVRQKHLHAIIIECSYDNSISDSHLYGHLTPHWVEAELEDLQQIAGVSLKNLPVVITHVKPTLRRQQDPVLRIHEELEAGNTTGVHFIMAAQSLHLRL